MTRDEESAKKLIFFAYQGKAEGNFSNVVESIKYAIAEYNAYQKTYVAKSWEEFRKSTIINKELLDIIDEAEVLVADLTHFNHNVLFELGYAIGRNKDILIMLNSDVEDAKKNYSNSFIKMLRYLPYQNMRDIKTALQQKDFEHKLKEQFKNISQLSKNSIDLLYIKSSLNDQASLELTEQLKSAEEYNKLNFLIDDPLEVDYRPLDWYMQNIYKSRCVIIHFRGSEVANALIENAKNSFLAGLSVGLGQTTLLVAPAKYKAPLDYYDILIPYQSSENLISSTDAWLKKFLTEARLGEVVAQKEKHKLDLIRLGIGGEIAENEKEHLLKYFLETSAYHAALTQDKIILVGRKGSGKSALYIKLLDQISLDPLSFLIDLKPDSSELLEDIELSKAFKNLLTRQTFFRSVWKLTILSKLAFAIYERILSKPEYSEFTKEEGAIVDFVESNERFIKMNVFGVIAEARRKMVDRGVDFNTPNILEDLYKIYLGSLQGAIKEYFKSSKFKYSKIVFIADNLDQAWDSRNDLDIQSQLIVSLLEIDSQISKELVDRDNRNIAFKTVIFLRKDIFEYILKIVKEPDKLITMAKEIEWEKHPELLRKIIENRFRFILELDNNADVESTWREFFDFGQKKHPFEVIDSIITRRPRDIIYFVGELFASSINRGGDKVKEEDLNYAIESYSNFLNNNLIAETRAEFPEISLILAKLQQHNGQRLEYKVFSKILDKFKYDQKRKDDITKTLFERGYMLGFDEITKQPFSDFELLKKKLEQRKWFVLTNRVYIIAQARYYLIKNLSNKSF